LGESTKHIFAYCNNFQGFNPLLKYVPKLKKYEKMRGYFTTMFKILPIFSFFGQFA